MDLEQRQEVKESAEGLSEESREKAIAAMREAKNEKDVNDVQPEVDPMAGMNEPGGEDVVLVDEETAQIVEPTKPETTLSEGQQLKLRLKQEMQRIRAKAQEELRAAERARLEVEAEKQKAAQLQAELDRKMQEAEALKRKAKEAPKDFLAEMGRPMMDLVKEDLEAGTDKAKISALEKQMQALIGQIQERDRLAEEAAKRAEEQRKAEEHNKALQAKREAQLKAESDLLTVIAEGAKDFPNAAKLLKKSRAAVLGQAYGIYDEVYKDLGRHPTFAELAKNIEALYEGDEVEEEKPKPVVKKATIKKAGTGGQQPLDLSTLDEDDPRRKALAMQALKAVRAGLKG